MIPLFVGPWAYVSCKPRASGDDPLWRKRLIHILAVNPARAGMILSPPIWSSHRAGKPRASGDDPPDQQANFDKSK